MDLAEGPELPDVRVHDVVHHDFGAPLLGVLARRGGFAVVFLGSRGSGVLLHPARETPQGGHRSIEHRVHPVVRFRVEFVFVRASASHKASVHNNTSMASA